MGDNIVLLPKPWVDFISAVNNGNKIAMRNIVAPDYGPSKGYNSNGLLKYISLTYPGRNIVKIERVLYSNIGQLWGVIDGIPMDKIPTSVTYNAFDTPHLVHQLYGVSKKGTFFPLKNITYAPILGLNWYIPMQFLQKIIYPKTVTVNLPVLKVMKSPDPLSLQVGSLDFNSKIAVIKIETGNGGIWGQTPDGGWISLRYQDTNYTDWQI